jgi:hypothetical protein
MMQIINLTLNFTNFSANIDFRSRQILMNLDLISFFKSKKKIFFFYVRVNHSLTTAIFFNQHYKILSRIKISNMDKM